MKVRIVELTQYDSTPLRIIMTETRLNFDGGQQSLRLSRVDVVELRDALTQWLVSQGIDTLVPAAQAVIEDSDAVRTYPPVYGERYVAVQKLNALRYAVGLALGPVPPKPPKPTCAFEGCMLAPAAGDIYCDGCRSAVDRGGAL